MLYIIIAKLTLTVHRARDSSGRRRRSRSAQRKGQARAAAHSPVPRSGRRPKKIKDVFGK